MADLKKSGSLGRGWASLHAYNNGIVWDVWVLSVSLNDASRFNVTQHYQVGNFVSPLKKIFYADENKGNGF